MMNNRSGVTIGDCHRYYTALQLKDWQQGEIAKILGVDRAGLVLGIDRLLSAMAVKKFPRSLERQQAFIQRKQGAIAKIMSRKRSPHTATAATFNRFFHFLVQVGFIGRWTEIDPITKRRVSKRTAPELQGADGQKVLRDYNDRRAGKDVKPQIEPPALYIVAPEGLANDDWNNPRSLIK
jgi:hypothetical protein